MAKKEEIVVKKKSEGEEEILSVEVGHPASEYPALPEKKLKEIGTAEAKKQIKQKAELQADKFENLVIKNSTRTLLRIKSAKLLDFFPSEIVIETNKVNVSKRDYFFMRRLHTLAIKDIEDVFIEETPVYAALKIVDKGFVENVVEVQFLKKDEAKKARRLIQGLVTAYKEGVDVAYLPDEELAEKLEILGDAGEVEKIKNY